MLNAITAFFKPLIDDQETKEPVNPQLAMACLLCEVSAADHEFDAKETRAKLALLSRLLDLDVKQAQDLLLQAKAESQQSASLYEFTDKLRGLSQEKRFELLQAMWQVATADGHIDPLEDAVIRKTAELLYVDHSQFIRAKLTVVEKENTSKNLSR